MLQSRELVHLLEGLVLEDLVVGGFAYFLVLQELHHVADAGDLPFLVDLDVGGTEGLRGFGGVAEE